jgi:transcriptional regulator with PAS, ATPase and Fis domain
MDNHTDMSEMDAVLVTDLDGAIVSIHEDLCRALNTSLPRVRGKNINDVFGPTLQGLPRKSAVVNLGQNSYKVYLEKVDTIQANKLMSLEGYFDQILDSIFEGVVIIDANRTIVYANKKACELMGTKLQSKNMLAYYAEEISDVSILDVVIKTEKPYTAINSFKNGLSSLTTGIPVFDKDTEELKFAVSVARNITELLSKQEAIITSKEPPSFPVKQFLSKSKKMAYIVSKIEVLTNPDLSILLTGETGTGKDYFARMMHEHAFKDSVDHPFIRVNCGAIPDSLLESELFGYEKGAFTGASESGKKGLIELANHGTLFLDEIGELPPSMQAKLLSTLQYREFMRVGGNKKITVTAKIICATNADLLSMTREKKFRLDLYYRISGITIKMPPLRERIGDIPYLVESMLNEMNKKYDKKVYFSLELLNIFLQYAWPGNIRELRNVSEKLVVFAENDRVDVNDLLSIVEFLGGESEKDLLKLATAAMKTSKEQQGLAQWMNTYEKTLLQQVLHSSKSLKEAASILGIDVSTLVRKKRKHEIKVA